VALVPLALVACSGGGGPELRPDAAAAARDGDGTTRADARPTADRAVAPDGPPAFDSREDGPDAALCAEVTGGCGPCGLPGPDGCTPVGVASCPDGFTRDGCGCAPVLSEDCGAAAIPALGGGCVPVGPQVCGDGFAQAADGRCAPVLAECGADELPRLGGECITVGVTQGCGEGTFGDIPDDPGTVHVDPRYDGGDADGSRARPFPDLETGLRAAPSGGTVVLAAGRYVRYPAIDRPLTLRGRCPELVELAGTLRVTLPGYGNDLPVRLHVTGTSDVVVEGLSITQGGALGIVVSDSRDVAIRQVHLAHVGPFGVLVSGSQGVEVAHAGISRAIRAAVATKDSADVTVRRCLVEDCRTNDGAFGWGLSFEGRLDATNLAEENLVRRCPLGIRLAYTGGVLRGNAVREIGLGTPPGPAQGILVVESWNARVEGNVLERVANQAVHVGRSSSPEIRASEVELVGNLVRDTVAVEGEPACVALVVSLPSGLDRLGLRQNVIAEPACLGAVVAGPLAAAWVEDNTVLAARHIGLGTYRTGVTLRRNFVTGLVRHAAQPASTGVVVSGGETRADPSLPVAVSANHVEGCESGGISVGFVSGAIEHNWIHDMRPGGDEAAGLFGLFVRDCDGVVVRGNVLARNQRNSFLFSGSTGRIDGNVVDATLAGPPFVDPDGLEWTMGQALMVLESPDVEVSRCVLRGAITAGLVFQASSGVLEGNVVEDVAPGAPKNGGFGILCDGVDGIRAAIVLRGNTVSRAAGAGILVQRATGTLEGNAVRDTRAGTVEALDGTQQPARDGIQLFDAGMDVRGCHLEGTPRAGIAASSAGGTIAGNLVHGATYGVRCDGTPLATLGPNACCAVAELCVAEGGGLVVQARPLSLPPLPP
jgi:hypothetical protein